MKPKYRELERIFTSRAQTRLVQCFLDYPKKLFNLSLIAKETGLAHSSVHRSVRPLVDLGLVKEIKVGPQIRLFILETEDRKTKILADFYTQIKRLLRQKTRGKRLERIFASRAQTRVVQYFLDHPKKSLIQYRIAKDTGLASSTLHRVIRILVKIGIVAKTRVAEGTHLPRVCYHLYYLSLNNKNRKTKILIGFYAQIRPLLRQKTGVRK